MRRGSEQLPTGNLVRHCRAFFVTLALAGGLAAVLPSHAADMTKTLHVAFPVAETGFDPQAAYDVYSFAVIGGIFDPLYVYDYFARPVRMVPNTAAALPEVTDQGRTYTIRVRPGIHFAADPAFKGKRRELTADDYVYSLKRIFDPKVRSYWLYVFEGNLVGLDEVLSAARKSGTFDYDAPLEGLRALDRYTLRIRFRRPNYGFEWWLTTNQFSAVAREVVDAYKDASNRVMENPVGTGAYRLKQWTRGQRILLEANSGYRDDKYPPPAPDGAKGDAAIAQGLTGRSLPLVGHVDISIVEEAQPRLLSFDSGGLDYVTVPATLAPNVLDRSLLKPEYAKRGIVLHRDVAPSIAFFFFNLDNPLVGGYTPDKIALRRAISMGYDRATAISGLQNGQALPASQLVPPPLYGHDPKYVAPYGYDLRAARALLDKFGHKDRDGDGYRELPDGKPLTLILASTTDNAARAADELWKRNMDALGLRITFLKNKWPELNKMSEAGQLMMWGLSWDSSVPDGIDYFSYFYSRNIGTSNDARMRLPAFDALYERSRNLPHGPVRTKSLRRNERHGVQLRPVDSDRLPVPECPGAAVGQGLQAEPFRHAPMALLRRRATSEMNRMERRTAAKRFTIGEACPIQDVEVGTSWTNDRSQAAATAAVPAVVRIRRDAWVRGSATLIALLVFLAVFSPRALAEDLPDAWQSFRAEVARTTPRAVASDEARQQDWWNGLWNGTKRIWNEGSQDFFVSGYFYHAPYKFSRHKRDEYNDNAWGGGYGRTLIDDDDNQRTLYGLVVRDSHRRPLYLAGYAWVARWDLVRDVCVGVGYSALLIAHSTSTNYWPVPLLAPVLSIGTSNVAIYATYFNGIGFFFTRFSLER